MKPTSVIFIIISVILACIGVLLCITASNMANEQGIGIFSQTGDANNNFITAHEFDSSELKKIVINANDVDVNVYGGSAKDMIELVNFSAGTYDYTVSKSTLQLSDNQGITSLVDLENFKINFNGFRDYLHYYKYRDKARTVNLYVTDAATVINLLITADSGNVTLNNLHLNKSAEDGKYYCDYKIKVGSGDVTLSHVSTESTIEIESSVNSRINLMGVQCNELQVNAVRGVLTLRQLSIHHKLYANMKSGSVDYQRTESNFAGFNVLLQAGNGLLRVYGNTVNTGKYTEDNIVVPETGNTTDKDPSGETTEDVTGGTETGEDGTEIPPEPVEEPNNITIIVEDGNIDVYS